MSQIREKTEQPRYHLSAQGWLKTPQWEPRGYIQPETLKELWFHTGTICNLSCPFCLEGSKPGDNRLNQMSLEDILPFTEEAVKLGVEIFAFTGGEPFVVKDMVRILDHCLELKPCLVLTNATRPLQMRFDALREFLKKPHPLKFRISLDYPDPQKHDAGRGEGNFFLALETARQLHELGFKISVARQRQAGEDMRRSDARYGPFLQKAGLPEDTVIVSFPDFLLPGSIAEVPHITESCMTTYHTRESRGKFMCHFSKMVVKKEGRTRVYACTLVDDDEEYDLGPSLKESMPVRIMLKHHRCYSCFAQGASCSER